MNNNQQPAQAEEVEVFSLAKAEALVAQTDKSNQTEVQKTTTFLKSEVEHYERLRAQAVEDCNEALKSLEADARNATGAIECESEHLGILKEDLAKVEELNTAIRAYGRTRQKLEELVQGLRKA